MAGFQFVTAGLLVAGRVAFAAAQGDFNSTTEVGRSRCCCYQMVQRHSFILTEICGHDNPDCRPIVPGEYFAAIGKQTTLGVTKHVAATKGD